MIELPQCRWRGEELAEQPGRYPCACPKLATKGSVSAETCRTCRHADVEAKPRERRAPVAIASRPAKSAAGPGTELKKLLADLGITGALGCGCDAKAARMNRWGPAGCREHRAEIVEWLKAQQEKRGWLATIAAAGRALATGAFWLDPLDPLGSLVDEAIRRAGPP